MNAFDGTAESRAWARTHIRIVMQISGGGGHGFPPGHCLQATMVALESGAFLSAARRRPC